MVKADANDFGILVPRAAVQQVGVHDAIIKTLDDTDFLLSDHLLEPSWGKTKTPVEFPGRLVY
jgi:hypothetical protein